MSEKRKAEETLCPIFAAVRIIIAGLNPEMKEVNLQTKENPKGSPAGHCLGRECQLFSVHQNSCGLRFR